MLKLMRNLNNHKGKVWSVAWSPNGSAFASCGEDKTVNIYQREGTPTKSEEDINEETRWKLARKIGTNHERTIRDVAWSPCGKYIAVASFDATISIWEKSKSGEYECVTTVEGHENEVKSVAWSPSGQYFASCSRDKNVMIWSWKLWHVCLSMTSSMINRFTSVCLRTNTRPQLVNSCRWLNPRRNESVRPLASEVLTCHLMNGPPWTSYFVKYSSIKDDQRGRSSFNWMVNGRNYRILRTGCWPYIKYHCTQGPAEDLSVEDAFFRVVKIINLGIPCLAYGLAATLLIRHTETVTTPHGPVNIYFLYKENKGAMY